MTKTKIPTRLTNYLVVLSRPDGSIYSTFYKFRKLNEESICNMINQVSKHYNTTYEIVNITKLDD